MTNSFVFDGETEKPTIGEKRQRSDLNGEFDRGQQVK